MPSAMPLTMQAPARASRCHELARDALAIRGRAPRTDHGDNRRLKRGPVAARPEHRWRIVQVAQAAPDNRSSTIVVKANPRAAPRVDEGVGLGVRGVGDLPRNAVTQRPRCGSKSLNQLSVRDAADVGDERQRERRARARQGSGTESSSRTTSFFISRTRDHHAASSGSSPTRAAALIAKTPNASGASIGGGARSRTDPSS